MATGIDIGSNSLRAVRIDCALAQKVAEYEKVVRTAQDLQKLGIITQEVIERICQAIEEAREEMGFDLPLKAVATAAFRKAKNAQEALSQIQQRTGIEVEIIDTQKECFYSAKGVEFGLLQKGIDTQKFLLADIGGGSTELILKHRSGLVCESFDVGILTAIERYRGQEELRFGIRQLMRPMREFLRDIYEIFGKPKIFVGTGGTPSTVAALKLGMVYESYDARRVSGTVIDLEDIRSSYRKLLILDPKKRAQIVGVGREEAIMAGLMILEELMDIAGYYEMVVSDEGVREGVALELCERVAPK
ncbi:MAG: phosphatase [Epsilonproteobacteria bacterium]|nr:phosphatase [Campylobacterota bacterium]NPA63430.1 phosphatase [Campylobacterota bacterium]